MTTLTAAILPVAEVFGLVNPNIADELNTYSFDVWPPHTNEAGIVLSGTLITSWPVEANGKAISGGLVGSYFDDYYNRIHLNPSTLNLGNLVSNQVRTVNLWNAYTFDKNVASVSYPSGVGISVGEPTPAPFVMKALQELSYAISISTNGPPTIDVNVTWIISGQSYILHIIGRRIIVWAYEPDWQQDFIENLTWLTDVFTARTGDEQRESIRSSPRRNFEYSLQTFKDNAATLQNLLFGWQNRTFAIPVWFDNSELATATTVGSLVINADTSNRGFFKGGLVLILVDPLNYEVREIEDFSSNTITLTNPIESIWAKGVKVFPVNIGRFPTQMQSSRVTDNVLTMQISFDADPLQTDPYIPASTAPITYAGYEMIAKKPNWSDPVNIENMYESSIVDYQTGGVNSVPSREFPAIMRTWQWLFKDRSELIYLRKMLGRLKGKAKAVYMPTWFADFQLYSTESAIATTLRVKPNEFYKMVGVNNALNVIAIETVNNPIVYRKILDVSVGAGYVSLALDGVIGYALDSNTLVKISLVHLCRMSADKASIKYLTNNVGVLQASFVLVRA